MNKAFYVDIAPALDRECLLGLPATPYEVLDALERNDTPVGEIPRGAIIEDGSDFGYLTEFFREPEDLLKLNELADRLAKLEGTEITAFEGLLKMEDGRKFGEIAIDDLLDIAFSAKAWCCHVLPDVRDDTSLGRFFVDNDFLPEFSDLPDSVLEVLDYAAIGKQTRLDEGGVFTDGGYVQRHSDIISAHEVSSLPPATPDYTLLLELEYEGKRAKLALPAAEGALEAASKLLGTLELNEVTTRCLDCAAPSLIDELDDILLSDADELAEVLDAMAPDELSAYKGLLTVVKPESVRETIHLGVMVNDYDFDPDLRAPEDVAMERLTIYMGSRKAAAIAKYMDLGRFGRDIMESGGETLTNYGLLKRRDGQPIMAQTRDQPWQGGMEMMM